MPFFAILIPSYNRKDYLLQAIRSVQMQRFEDYECWITDDASTDGTWDALRALALDERFHIARNEVNRRQHYSRNRAIERSSAPWITFLDSDDLWLPDRLNAFQDAIRRSPETRFWFSNGYLFDGSSITGRFFSPERDIPTGILPGYYAVGRDHLPYVTTNVAVHRSAFQDTGLFREDMQILEDTELYARMLACKVSVGVIRTPVSLYRSHASQITRRYRTQFKESCEALANSSTPRDRLNQERTRRRRETGIFLIKSLQNSEARAFLSETGNWREVWDVYLLTFIPTPILGVLKGIFAWWNRMRASPLVHDPACVDAQSFLRSIQQERP